MQVNFRQRLWIHLIKKHIFVTVGLAVVKQPGSNPQTLSTRVPSGIANTYCFNYKLVRAKPSQIQKPRM